MENTTDQAITGFRSGLNCAQSVLTAYSDKYKINREAALSLSCSFGAGMGRLQGTCGAVTGAYMVIGLDSCSKYATNKERKENAYSMVQEFSKKFMAMNKTVNCAELLKVDLKTPEGQKAFHDNRMSEVICEKCISDAVNILDNILR